MVADELLSSQRVIKDGKDRITLAGSPHDHRVEHKISGFDGGELYLPFRVRGAFLDAVEIR